MNEPASELPARFEDLRELLDRDAVLLAALRMLAQDGSDAAWFASPGENGGLALEKVVGDRAGALRGLLVPGGQGLTGRVHLDGRPRWVDDYFSSGSITHHFDEQIAQEGILRLLAVPLGCGRSGGVLALGARSHGQFGGRGVDHALDVAGRAASAVSLAERARQRREIAVSEERRRISSDLHDTVGALLFAIGSGMRELASSLGDVDPEITVKLDQLRDQAVAATTALRDSSRTLRSSPAALALGVALQGDCEAFADRTGVPAQFVLLDEDPSDLGPARTAVVVAAVREALLNVEKHACATAVVVTASRVGRGLCVVVADDGIGGRSATDDDADGHPDEHRHPETGRSGQTAGIGLSRTREAVERLGGDVTVSRDPQGGTTWRLRLPWAPA